MKRRVFVKHTTAFTALSLIPPSALLKALGSNGNIDGSALTGFNNGLFMEAVPERSSMFRWWIPAGFVTREEIEKEIRAVAEAGFKGLEICVHMSDSDYSGEQLKSYGWGTDEWNGLYAFILERANHYGVQIDTTVSPAWPAAIPSIRPEDDAAAKELRYGYTELFAASYSGGVPAPKESQGNMPAGPGGPGPGEPGPGGPPPGRQQGRETDVPNPEVLIAVTAAKITAKAEVTKEQVMNWGDMPYQPESRTQEAELLDMDSMTDITGTVTYDQSKGVYSVNWTAPGEGQWRIFSFWMRGTAQQNREGSATAEPCYVVNHFGVAGSKALTAYWEEHLLNDRIRNLLRENKGSLFEDSLELESDGLQWTVEMLDEFRNRRGYDLTPWLPFLIGQSMGGMTNVDFFNFEADNGKGIVSDVGDRIRNDFSQLLTDLYIDNHIDIIQNWAKSIGLGYRAQAYSAEIDIMKTSAYAFGPDGESLGFGPGSRGDDRFRMVAGGAHVGGRPVIGDEVGAIANEGYRLTWKDMLRWINKNYAAGANLMIFHGMPYADSNTSRWPGYSPFGFNLAGYWGLRQPGWENISELADYLSRTQEILQGGKPQVDVAICHYDYGSVAPVFQDQSLTRSGYTYDIISPALLELPLAEAEQGILAPDGPSYKALVLDNQVVMAVETAEKLLDFAGHGFHIVFIGETPSRAPFYSDWKANDKRLGKVMKKLLKMQPFVKSVAGQSDVADALRSMGISPSADYSVKAELYNTCRLIEGNRYYFLYNYGDTALDMNVTFKGAGIPYSVDQWSGRTERIAQYTGAGDSVLAQVELVPQETAIILVKQDDLPVSGLSAMHALQLSGGNSEAVYHENRLAIRAFGEADCKADLNNGETVWVTVDHIPDEIALEQDWYLSVESWENAGDPQRSSVTKKNVINVGITALKPWKDIDVLGEAISGIGTYTTRFTLDETWRNVHGARIDLGSVYGCNAALWVNGVKVPVNQFTGKADVENLLEAGVNSIKVKVASTLGNRLIKDGAISPASWDPSAVVEYEDYGLTGPVRIIPCQLSVIEKPADITGAIIPVSLSTEYIENPFVIDTPNPRLAWKLESSARSEMQTAYQVLVSDSKSALYNHTGSLWDSGKVKSGETLDIEYQGQSLQSGKRYFWKVRVWDKKDAVSDWSEIAFFETGLMSQDEWNGDWINVEQPDSNESSLTPLPLVRKEFETRYGKTIDCARLYLAAEGYCYVRVNDQEISNWVNNPVESAYDRRMLYTPFDITSQLRRGRNALGIELGRGPLIIQLNIRYHDGSIQTVTTNGDWKYSMNGPFTLVGRSRGELYDARREIRGWSRPGFDDSNWKNVKTVEPPTPILQAQLLPVTKVAERFSPVKVVKTKKGSYVFDAGKVTAGWAGFTGSAPSGTEMVIWYGEKIKDDGTVEKEYNNPMGSRSINARDRYIFNGNGVETWSPRFAFKGFRYVEIEGYPGELGTDNVHIEPVHSEVVKTGDFTSSNELFNTLHNNMCNTILNNLHGVFTTTPVFEKGLTTGDVNFAAESMLFNFSMVHIFLKAITDLRDSQAPNGALPELAPNMRRSNYIKTVPEWTSLIINIPWYLYQYTGSARYLEDFYDSAKRYADYEITVLEESDYIGDSFFGGDWNSPEGEMSPEGGAITGSAYQYRTMLLLSETAAMLGKHEDADHYGQIADKIKRSVNERLLSDDIYETPVKLWAKRAGPPMPGRSSVPDSEKMPVGYRQASNVVPLAFDMVPAGNKKGVLDNLIRNIHAKDDHLDTGCIATKYLLVMLSEEGHGDLAYKIATQRTFPSWGYWVDNGATTMWEGWNADCRSYDHFYLGSGLEEWLFKILAGISTKAGGFGEIIIKPYVLGDLDHVKASTDSSRGMVSSEWHLDRSSGAFKLDIRIPVNAFATVHVPCDNDTEITEQGRPAVDAEGIGFAGTEEGYRIYRVGSGVYSFASRLRTRN